MGQGASWLELSPQDPNREGREWLPRFVLWFQWVLWHVSPSLSQINKYKKLKMNDVWILGMPCPFLASLHIRWCFNQVTWLRLNLAKAQSNKRWNAVTWGPLYLSLEVAHCFIWKRADLYFFKILFVKVEPSKANEVNLIVRKCSRWKPRFSRWIMRASLFKIITL